MTRTTSTTRMMRITRTTRMRWRRWMRKFFFAKMHKITKYTSLPDIVRLDQWKQVSDEY